MPLKIAGDNKAVFAVSGDYYGARERASWFETARCIGM
jgi:hypothetical protein